MYKRQYDHRQHIVHCHKHAQSRKHGTEHLIIRPESRLLCGVLLQEPFYTADIFLHMYTLLNKTPKLTSICDDPFFIQNLLLHLTNQAGSQHQTQQIGQVVIAAANRDHTFTQISLHLWRQVLYGMNVKIIRASQTFSFHERGLHFAAPHQLRQLDAETFAITVVLLSQTFHNGYLVVGECVVCHLCLRHGEWRVPLCDKYMLAWIAADRTDGTKIAALVTGILVHI